MQSSDKEKEMQNTNTVLLAEAGFECAEIRLYKDPEALPTEAYWTEIDEGNGPGHSPRMGLYDALADFTAAVRFEEIERF